MLTGRKPTARRWRVRTAVMAVAALATGWAGLLAATPARADVASDAEQWVISELNLRQAWARTQGNGVTVAVIDSGVNGDVSDLAGSVTTGPDDSGVSTPPSNPFWGRHGTWMASLVAGHGHDGDNGIFGAAPQSRVLSIRVITDQGDPSYQQYEKETPTQGQTELADAIKYAVEQHAGVISMSLGYSMQSRAVRAALQDAYDNNVVVVASAGNSGNSAGASGNGAPYSFPADYPGVLGVAAVNASGQVASFSSDNLSVQVAAPGDRVPAQGNDGQYWYVSGTSPACALTAGVVALIKSAYPKLTDPQVISAITSSTTAATRPSGGWDDQIGFGVVNAGQALAAAGTIAAAGQPAVGLAATSHFGGGPAAVPAAPFAPRGPAALIGYVLLAIACLAVVGFATGRLFSPGASARRAAGELGPSWPAGPGRPPAFPAPAGPAPDLSGRRPEDAATRPLRSPAGDWPDAAAAPAGYESSDGQRTRPPGPRPSAWPGARPQQPRHAAPRGARPGQQDQP